MIHTCQNCNHEFELELHERTMTEIKRNTGCRTLYKGETDEEFAQCPNCDALSEEPIN